MYVCYFFAFPNFFVLFSANKLYFLISVRRPPLGQSEHIIPTFYSELNEDCDKNMFFISSPTRPEVSKADPQKKKSKPKQEQKSA